MIRVLLVDDHMMVREGLGMLLLGEPGIEVVGGAASAREAMELVEALAPDVVLMDVNMPDIDGLTATRQITTAHPDVSVIIVSVLDSPAYFVDAMRSGATGYLTKDCTRELLISAVRAAVEGAVIAHARIVREAFDRLLTLVLPDEAVAESLHKTLTVREIEVLGLMAQGHGYATMRKELVLAEVTVKKHVQSIVAKLGVSDRTQAAIIGVRLGLDHPPRGADGLPRDEPDGP